MTEPAALFGTTSVLPPNGPGPPPAPAPRRGRLHTRISEMHTELIAGLPAPGHARPSADMRDEGP
jgi:hypothetical protein